MSQDRNAVSEKSAKSSMNWPVLAAAAACLLFITGVWINAYRVSHAAPTPAPMAAPK